jgi:hypothetical protein
VHRECLIGHGNESALRANWVTVTGFVKSVTFMCVQSRDVYTSFSSALFIVYSPSSGTKRPIPRPGERRELLLAYLKTPYQLPVSSRLVQ